MKTFNVNGTTKTADEIKAELKACNISLDSNKTHYRWIHAQLGVVYDSLDTFYQHMKGVNHNDYFSITPAKDLI